MENLKELQKKIKILSNISTVISLVVVVFALLGLLVMKDSPLAFVCPALVIIELSILFYIRKKCTCNKCGHALSVKEFLKLKNWNCPRGKHKMN